MLPRTFQNMSPPCCILSSVETARLKGHGISSLFAQPTILRYSVRRRKLAVYRTNILPAVLAAFLSVCAWERTQLAAVSGAITDPSGAMAPGASVTVVNQGTALKRGVLTDSADEYRFAGSRTGTYSLRIEKAGFQSQIRAGVEPTLAVLDFDNADIQSLITLERPNVVSHPNAGVCPNGASVGTPSCWFNPRAFAVPPAGQIVNAGRNILRGAGFGQPDPTIHKDFAITDQAKITIGVEAYNLFNHPNFGVPSHTQNPPVMGGNGDAVFKAAAGGFAANVKQILTTAGAARQIQLVGRFIF